jgi:hypothetical protein
MDFAIGGSRTKSFTRKRLGACQLNDRGTNGARATVELATSGFWLLASGS